MILLDLVYLIIHMDLDQTLLLRGSLQHLVVRDIDGLQSVVADIVHRNSPRLVAVDTQDPLPFRHTVHPDKCLWMGDVRHIILLLPAAVHRINIGMERVV